MIRRNITRNLLAALSDSPVVLLHGTRQTGKSTLIRHVAAGEHRARYLTFDDAAVLAAAKADPAGFLAGLDGPVASGRNPAHPGTAGGDEGLRRPEPAPGAVPAHWLGERDDAAQALRVVGRSNGNFDALAVLPG